VATVEFRAVEALYEPQRGHPRHALLQYLNEAHHRPLTKRFSAGAQRANEKGRSEEMHGVSLKRGIMIF
jgi:hypothetical protein